MMQVTNWDFNSQCTSYDEIEYKTVCTPSKIKRITAIAFLKFETKNLLSAKLFLKYNNRDTCTCAHNIAWRYLFKQLFLPIPSIYIAEQIIVT